MRLRSPPPGGVSVHCSVRLLEWIAVVAGLRERCPSCRTCALASTRVLRNHRDDLDGRSDGGYVSHYTCAGCGAQFRQHESDGLVPLEMWERGARHPPPRARIER